MAGIDAIPAFAPAFLEAAGWADARIEPLAGDASFRRYFRVQQGERRAMLMDAPPPNEDPRPFLAIAEYLHSINLRAPAILAADAAAGLVLLEDFGTRRMREHIDMHPEDERAIYRAAIDTLIVLHAREAAPLRAYDSAEYQREAGLFVEYYCPAQGLDVDGPTYVAAWNVALAPLLTDGMPPVTVLRDYHAENIMLLDDGGQGLLDFQDALLGHPAYDLVSLLQDARRDVSPALEAEMLAHYCTVTQAGDEFTAHYALLGAQRNAKIVGIFVRLWKRDGKPRYLDMIPRVWAAMERDLAHPALAPVAAWFDANIPAALRAELGGAIGK